MPTPNAPEYEEWPSADLLCTKPPPPHALSNKTIVVYVVHGGAIKGAQLLLLTSLCVCPPPYKKNSAHLQANSRPPFALIWPPMPRGAGERKWINIPSEGSFGMIKSADGGGGLKCVVATT